MKHLLFISIWLLLSATAMAQEIKVKDMELLPSDLTARTNPRLDGNDEPCALIKVIVPAVEGIQFEGWVIGNVQYRPGEYQVYVPAGTKKINFRHPNYAPGEIRFTIPIDGKCTYRVILDVPQKSDGLESIEQGDAAAMLKQAQNYEKGAGAYSKDLNQALIWYEKAAEAGNVEAQEYLADVLYLGNNGFTKDTDKALRWNKECSKRGRVEVLLRIAKLYDEKKLDSQAIIWYVKYTEHIPDSSIQFRIAQLLYSDAQKNKWLKIAADNGHIEASYQYATRIARSNIQESAIYYQKAVDGNHIKAMYDYGLILSSGQFGFSKDEEKGNRLLNKARTNYNIRTKERAKLNGLQTLEVNGIAFNGVLIKKGQIAHSGNYIDNDYYISELPISVALWNAVMGKDYEENDHDSYIRTDYVIWTNNKRYYGNIWAKAKYSGKPNPYDILPNELQAFLKKLNELTKKKFRVPKLMELQHAAFGGGQRRKSGQELGIVYIDEFGDYANDRLQGYVGSSKEEGSIYDNYLRLVW